MSIVDKLSLQLKKTISEVNECRHNVSISSQRKESILVLSPYEFVQRRQGGAIRTNNICNILARHFNLVTAEFFWAANKEEQKICSTKLSSNWSHYRCPHKMVHKKQYIDGEIKHLSQSYTPEMAGLALKIIKEHKISLLWLEFSYMAPYQIISKLANIPCILSIHNIESDIIDRHKKNKEDSRTRKAENKLLSQSNHIVCTTNFDRKYCQIKSPMAKIHVAPNVVDMSSRPANSKKERSSNSNEIKIIFIGDAKYGPNKEGLEWFFKDILTEDASEQLKGTSFNIYGKGSDMLEHLGKGKSLDINFCGFADNIQEVYDEADISLIPLLSGGGSRLKAFEAMNNGLSILTTPKGTEGIEFHDAAEFVYEFTNSAQFIRCIAKYKKMAENPDKKKRKMQKMQKLYMNNIKEFEDNIEIAAKSALQEN